MFPKILLGAPNPQLHKATKTTKYPSPILSTDKLVKYEWSLSDNELVPEFANK